MQTSAVALVTVALVFAGTSLLFGSTSGALVSGTNFTITSPSPGPVLYPLTTTPSNLPLTFSNPLNAPIRVFSLTVSFTNTFPSLCPYSELTLNGSPVTLLPSPVSAPGVTFSFTGTSFAVPKAVGATPGTAIDNLTLALPENHQNQDACQGLALTMSYSATAQYTASTTTVLTATPMSPGVAGQPVTLSATVSTSTAGATTPVGSVIFYSCTNVSCASKTALGSAVNLNSSGLATTITTPATTGSYYYEAIYTPSDNTNFTPSTSNVLSRPVGYSSACGASGKINGSYTVSSGQSIFVNCSVNGGITVQSGGALFLQGATVNGGVTSTSASALMICGSSINGGVTATGTTGFVLIGDGGDDGTPACAANTIKGGVTLNNGKGGFEIAGSSITGGVSVAGNTGTGPTTEDAAPEVEGNSITGGLSCATSNSPALSNGGQKNTVTGTKSGQCSAAGF